MSQLARLGVVRPLAIRDFRLLWIGMTVSMVGDGVYVVAMALQVFEITNGPSALGWSCWAGPFRSHSTRRRASDRTGDVWTKSAGEILTHAPRHLRNFKRGERLSCMSALQARGPSDVAGFILALPWVSEWSPFSANRG